MNNCEDMSNSTVKESLTVQALELALEALETAWYHVGTFCPTDEAIELYDDARAAIKEALTQRTAAEGEDTLRAWVGLTTDDWDEIRKQVKYNFEMTTGEYAERVSHLVEDKLREKNT